MKTTPTPQPLPPNLFEHFYRGGQKLAAWRGFPAREGNTPEEWVASTVHRYGDPEHGPSRLDDGRLLRDAVLADPHAWLGHPDASEADTGILVKLLDAGQRLPVHVHPTRDFAHRHLGVPYGKTEAWYVLGTEPGASVWLGWKDQVEAAQLARLVAAQDAAGMLALMHEVPVEPGQGILVPGGTAHAIGAGILVVEAQEPTDQSILLEKTNPNLTTDEMFLGLGQDLALSAVATSPLDDVSSLIVSAGGAAPGAMVPVLPETADPYFRMHLLGAGAPVEAGFAVVVPVSGTGHLVPDDAPALPLAQGQTWVVPAATGGWRLSGDLVALVCRPGTSWPPPRP